MYLGKYEICTADLERTIANPLYEQKTIIATSLIKNFQTL